MRNCIQKRHCLLEQNGAIQQFTSGNLAFAFVGANMLNRFNLQSTQLSETRKACNYGDEEQRFCMKFITAGGLIRFNFYHRFIRATICKLNTILHKKIRFHCVHFDRCRNCLYSMVLIIFTVIR